MRALGGEACLRILSVATTLAIGFAFSIASVVAQSGERANGMALVIAHQVGTPGSSDDGDARRDADRMAQRFTALGYNVMRENQPSQARLDAVFREFEVASRESRTVVLFYAGPVRFLRGDVQALPAGNGDAIPLIEKFGASSPTAANRIVIVDGCRIVGPPGTSDAPSINPGSRMYIALAQTAGKACADRGPLSPFTTALDRYLGEGVTDMTALMDKTRTAVLVATKDLQVPWDISTLGRRVSLIPQPAANTAPPEAALPPQLVQPSPPQTKSQPPPSPTAQLEVHRGRAIEGGDLENPRGYAGNSVADCAQRCASDPRCNAMSFDRWNRRCFLKRAPTGFRIDPKYVSAVRADQKIRDSTDSVVVERFVRKSSPTAPYATDRAASFAQCEQLCLADQRCEAINYQHDGQLCSRLREPDEYQTNVTMDFGVKRQPAQASIAPAPRSSTAPVPTIAPPAPLTRAGPSHWWHNGSLMELRSDGRQRAFYYVEPRAGVVRAGVNSGTQLFAGERTGDAYQGTAYIFRGSCGKWPYDVSGIVSADERRVTMTGQAPLVDANCVITGYRGDELVFELRSDE